VAESITRTTCPYCGVGCGVLATRNTEGVVTISGDPGHPANFGKLCSKGLTLGETLGHEQRLLTPMISGADTSWDKATTLVAQKLSEAIAEHGPDAVAFYVSGQLLTEDYYVANKLMKGFIGSANIDTNSRLCMASAVAGHKRAFGADVVPCNYTDLEQADLVVLVGSNLAWCHPILFQRLQAARELRGTKLVVIDPRKTASAVDADLFLQIAPGSDVALFNGLLRDLYQRGEIDSQFVFANTQGLSEAVLAAGDFDVSKATGLSQEDLKKFYDLFAAHPKTVTAFSMGVNQAVDGTDKVNAIINCHLLTGRIGKEGAGPFSITGQPNAMGGREVGSLANMLAAHMAIENPLHRSAVQEFWKSPNIALKSGFKAVDLFEAVRIGKIKALWIIATNPAVSLPNSSLIEEALSTCPFVVVSDVTGNTETAGYADVLLPAMGWGEKEGTVTNSERRISRQRQFIKPVGSARADWRIICDVAKAMGFSGFDFETPADIFAEHVALTQVLSVEQRPLNLSALENADYETLGPSQWGGTRPFADGQFATPNGKANFVATAFRKPQIADDHFTLNTGRIRDQWHTMTRTGLVPKLFNHRAEPYLEISPQDAQRVGLRDAELAEISGVNGHSIVRVLVTDSISPGHVFQPMHWSGLFASHAKANSASASVVDPVSGQPALKSAPVQLSRFAAAWQGFGVSMRNINPATDYWAQRPLASGVSFECGDQTLPSDWQGFVRRFCNEELSFVASSNPAQFRCAAFKNGRLQFAFFTSAGPVEVSRHWLQQLLGTEVNAAQVLAGRPAAGLADNGPIVCSCNGVGRNTISSFIKGHAGATLKMVCQNTNAGMGCGSCRPEVQKLINETAGFALAAE
jgi:assimilatory nitrate reductase catalytic subunit